MDSNKPQDCYETIKILRNYKLHNWISSPQYNINNYSNQFIQDTYVNQTP